MRIILLFSLLITSSITSINLAQLPEIQKARSEERRVGKECRYRWSA